MAEAPRILVCDQLPESALMPLWAKGYQVDLNFKIPQDELHQVIGDYDGLILRSGKKITADVLNESGRLKVIARAGVGVDNIDLDAATARGIAVLNTPDGNTIAAAELTMLHILEQARHLCLANQSVTEGKWERGKFMGTELYESTLGIIGLGKIGEAVAKRAGAFGMKLIGFDPAKSEEAAAKLGVELVSLETLFKNSDFITLHVPLLKNTRLMINADTLKLCKQGTRLINVARGELVDMDALLYSINEGSLAGAGLDVFPVEGNVPENIRLCRDISKTPHLGASTKEAQDRVAKEAAEGVIDFLEGRFPSGLINARPVSDDTLRQISPFIPVTESVAILASWLSGGSRIEQVEAYLYGEIAGCSDTRPLRLTIDQGLFSSFFERPINIVNYKMIEDQMGLKVTEIKSEANGAYRSLFKLRLYHGGTNTTVTGVNAHGPVKIIEVNGYPVDFTFDKKSKNPILFCTAPDIPFVISKISTLTGKRGINIEEYSYKASQREDGRAMSVSSLSAPLGENELEVLNKIEHFSVRQYIP